MTASAGPMTRRWLAAPLWLRILALVAGALIASQAVTLALTLVFPPEPPQQHSLPDIARALGGAGGKPDLILSRAEAPPSLQSPGWVTSPRLTGELAVLLDVPASDVRLLFYAPPPLAGFGPPPPPRPMAALDGEAALRAAIQGVVGGPAQAQSTAPGPGMPAGGRMGTPMGGMAPVGGYPGAFARSGPDMTAGGGPRPMQDPRFTQGVMGQRRPGSTAGLRQAGGPRAISPRMGAQAPTPAGAAMGGQGQPSSLSAPGMRPAQTTIFREAAPYVTRGGATSAIPTVSTTRPATDVGPAGTPANWTVAGWSPPDASGVSRPPIRAAGLTPAGALRAPLRAAPFMPVSTLPQPMRRVSPAATEIGAPSAVETPSPSARRLATPVAAISAMAPAAVEAHTPQTVQLEAPAASVIDRAAATPAAPEAPEVTLAAPERAGMFGLTRASLVEGEFVAALRTKGGDWTIVRPRPEGFPNSWQRRVLLWFGLSFALIAPAALFVAWRLTSPLQRFAEAAERLGREPTADMRPLEGPAEIGRAAAAFNVMQLRLKRYVEDRTGMVAAISHDLRTPLARMRFKLERARPALRASMSRDMDHMEAMITSVLNFMHHDAAAGRREPVDLRSVLEVVVDDAGPRAELEPGPPVIVEADLIAIQRVFENLVDNALKYGEHARVSLRSEGAEAFVEVTDDGPGLADDELETVFKPFYRSAAAKASGSTGVGLGLPVSRSAVRAHGGDLVIRPTQTGLTAEVRLPLSLVPVASGSTERAAQATSATHISIPRFSRCIL